MTQIKVKIIVAPIYHTVNAADFQEAWEEHIADTNDDGEYVAERDGPPTPEFVLERFGENLNDGYDTSDINDKISSASLDAELVEEDEKE